VGWINRFLDQCCVRGLAWHTLRGYAFDLTHFVRWWADRHCTDEVTVQALTSSSLLDYVRYQADQQPRPAASTINTRVWGGRTRFALPSSPTSLPQPRRAFSSFTGDSPGSLWPFAAGPDALARESTQTRGDTLDD